MDRGTETGAPEDGAADEAMVHSTAGRIPLAVVVVDRGGLVSHWSTGARRLFGATEEEAVGHPAADLLPVSGALHDDEDAADESAPHGPYDGLGPGLRSPLGGRVSHPAAGRARLSTYQSRPTQRTRRTPQTHHRETHQAHPLERDDRIDVLWWAYPLVGPGRERLLVLAADAARLRVAGGERGLAVERIAPAFALHTDFPGAEELARGLPEILPGMSVGESSRIVSQVLELGCPVLEFSPNDRVPVTPDRGVARRTERRARREDAARAAASGEPVPQELEDDAGEDLEHLAVRERLKLLDEVGFGIGTSLDLAREVRGEDIGVGPATLRACAAHPAASMGEACDAVIRALAVTFSPAGRGGRKDDVALLMARLNGVAPDDVGAWRLACDPIEVGRARAVVREQLHDWGLDALADDTELMVSELVTNAVRHAHGRHIGLRLVRGESQ